MANDKRLSPSMLSLLTSDLRPLTLMSTKFVIYFQIACKITNFLSFCKVLDKIFFQHFP